jgi:hypothetical protein
MATRKADMSTLKPARLAGAATLVAGLLLATLAWAETKPPTSPAGRNAPPPKGVKWEGPDFDAAKGRTPATGKGYSLPEKDDEVLLRSRKGGR